MKKALLFAATLLASVSVLAEETAAAVATTAAAATTAVTTTASINGGLVAIGAALAIGLAVFAGTSAQGKAASAALEGMARNPAASDKLFTPLILSLALIESLVILAFLVAFVKLPAGSFGF